MNKSKVEIKIDAVFSFQLSSDIYTIDDRWESVSGGNTYLSVSYLKALQHSKIPFLDFFYVVLYKKQQPVACFYFQKIALRDSLLKQDKFPNQNNQFRSLILKYTNTDLLVCGNFFATGVNGFFFKQSNFEYLVPVVVEKVSTYLKKRQNKVSLLMFKEFWTDKNKELQQKIGKEYGGFQIDVNMILDIHPKWSDFDTYLGDLKTKYRTRVKNIFKKTSDLVGQEFSSEEILHHQHNIDALFGKVLETSDFNVAQPNANFFYQLKINLKEKFLFKGYFYQNKLVAFSVATFNQGYLDANYVGIDYELNKELSIYQRLLYDYVRLAIDKKVKRLRLGRTAEIMKSSLGAIAVPMNLYIKHNNILLHQILKPALSHVKASPYEIRKPFKA